MPKLSLSKIIFAGAAAAAPVTGLAAQPVWTPGAEIVGQTVQVQTNGVVNNIYFAPDGTATISTPQGTSVPGTWSAANNMLCLSANGGQECFPYAAPFQAGQQVALTSSCQQVATFMAQGTNPPPMPPEPVQNTGGERG